MKRKKIENLASNLTTFLNESMLNNTKNDLSHCGINDCPGSASGEAAVPPELKTVIFIYIYALKLKITTNNLILTLRFT